MKPSPRVALVALLSLAVGACDNRTVTTQDGSAPAADSGRKDARPRTDASLPTPDAAPPVGDAQTRVVCDPSAAQCESLPPACPSGQMRSVENGCWGPCVELRACEPVECDSAKVACRAMQPDCEQQSATPGRVPMVVNSCWGPCVPIEICRCEPNGPRTQCPLEGFVCHNYRRACGPLE